MYTGGVRKTIAKRSKKKYDQRNAHARSRLMLLRRCRGRGAFVIEETETAVIPRYPPIDVAQDKDCGNGENREHEQRDTGAERNVAALDANPERPGGEDVRLVDRAA